MATARTAAELDAVLDETVAASRWLAGASLAERAGLLRSLAESLEAAPQLAELAAEETRLAVDRLRGEQARTVMQLRLYADVAEEGSWLDAAITHASPEATPPVPDLRRINVPLGPVLVFAASNFPLAFGVVGTDTAAALAVGAAVVAKPHPGHPRLGQELHDLVVAVLSRAGAPAGAFSLVVGDDLAVAALQDRRVRAGAFTGSIRGGTALLEIAGARPRPIPFYAEMGSVNPVVVTGAALAERGQEILDGFVASMTTNLGQLCTSPGVVFVPRGALADVDVERGLSSTAAGPLLTESVHSGYVDGQARMRQVPGLRQLGGEDDPRGATPVVWRGDLSEVRDAPGAFEECFGPSAVVLEYDDAADVTAVLADMDGQLTGSVFVGRDERPDPELLDVLSDRCGRIVVNGWPTGLAVNWSTHHGGPWPSASSPLHGSVGAEALRRFVRPVSYQGVAQEDLPEALRDRTGATVRRRVDGVLDGTHQEGRP